ncbi:hypothetical protein HOH87_03465 [bacterium]|jgi:hypothetical protein|nr:hypothetical protein [bacterium]
MKLVFSFFLTLILILSNTMAMATPSDRHPVSWDRFFKDETLIVSNYPERLTHPGVIFNRRMTKPSLRVMYYHKNDTSKSMWINLIVHNKGKKEASIQVLKGLGGPDKDGLSAGHRATNQFIKHLQKGAFSPKTIPPGDSIQLVYQQIKPSMVSSGMIKLDNLSKEPLSVELQAVESGHQQFTRLIPESEERTPFKVAQFDSGLIRKSVRFDPKDRILEIPIGDTPFLKDDRSKIVLKGNYGVLYTVKVALENSSGTYEHVNLLFSRISGYAKATILLNDKLLVTKSSTNLSVRDPELLHTISLAPHSKQTFTILISPEGGSFYPANLVLQRVPF